MSSFQYKNITVGADPELFLKHAVTGQYIAACGLIGGTKDKPKKLDKKGHAIQEDNVMVEFNIPPAKDAKHFDQSIQLVLNHLAAMPELQGLVLTIEAAAEFADDQLTSPQARQFGCDPDYDAWKMVINPAPNPNTKIRTCGGHIHVGYENPEIENQVALIRAMDLFVGVPSIVLDPDTIRKARYGRAGAFRPKGYGAEYRVASNYWIKNKPLREWAFQQTQRAVAFLNEGGEISENLANQIQETINHGNVQVAKDISREYKSLEGV